MSMVSNILIVVQVLCAIAIIVLVLLQHGKGADMGAAFGGGASGSLFGATGSANFLSRMTGAVATLFFLVTLGLAFTASAVRVPQGPPAGVMGTIPSAPAPAAPSEGVPVPATPGKAGEIPVK